MFIPDNPLTAEEWVARHDEKIAILSETGCWIWMGSQHPSGYGQCASPFHPPRERRPWPAHRASYFVHKGEIPEGMWVRHDCDVKECVNPNHLRIGTPAENAADMTARERQSRGSRRPGAKLTERQVASIRAQLKAGKTQPEIARTLGVSQSVISRIKSKKTWKHV